MPLPQYLSVHEHKTWERRLLSVRFSSHPVLQVYFPQVPESYLIDGASLDGGVGSHWHKHKCELFRCVSGMISVALRFCHEGRSFHATVLLEEASPYVLLIPSGVWHRVSFLAVGSRLIVWSSTLYNDEHPDEIRGLPPDYTGDTSEHFEMLDPKGLCVNID